MASLSQGAEDCIAEKGWLDSQGAYVKCWCKPNMSRALSLRMSSYAAVSRALFESLVVANKLELVAFRVVKVK